MSQASLALTEHFRKSGWLPASQAALDEWLATMIEQVHPDRMEAIGLLPEVQDFQDFIENDGKMYMGFHQMLEGTTSAISNYQTLVRVLNKILREAPFYGDIGPPVYMVLNQAMNTQGGYATFLSSKLNAHFKRMFDAWALFLSSAASCYVLEDTPRGWFSTQAKAALVQNYDGLTFEETFICDKELPHHGYTSWDDFFNRTFQPGVRTLELPHNSNIINGACESKLYKIARNVNEFDNFWIKGEPYSLRHMLNHDPDYATRFIGGTVFQGFLEVTGYHRWNSPVTGTIKKIVQVPGTYFVESPAVLGEADNPYLRSLSFITAITTRLLIFIESDNPLIGLMCFIAIGMTRGLYL